MCGIAGYWDLKTRHNTEQMSGTVTRMRDQLIHRGPDGADNWIDAGNGIAFGHRRLAIVDLSEHGKQPMISANQRYVMMFNGEIYNHQEIKQQLIASGLAPNWRGHSDTEVALAAFEAWGVESAVQQFTGMFAIALWDQQQKLLYLIRDRLGEKPLYYGWVNNNLLFGSELKSLKVHPDWQQSIDPQAVSLMMQYNCIPAPFTIYKDIFKLEPGKILVINSQGSMQTIPYWELRKVAQQAKLAIGANEAVDLLEQRLGQAVKQQMVADVPVGAFLSGGIDSSTIVALMQANSSSSVRTFTIGFEEAAYNEAEQAKAIAQHLGTEHTELYLSAEQTRAVIPAMAKYYDEPFADSSQVPTYMVAQLTRQHVTVSLSGDGGDELFAGYNRYSWVPQIWRRIAFLPQPLRQLLSKLMCALPPAQWDKLFKIMQPLLPAIARQRNPGDKLHKLARVISAPSARAIYHQLVSHWYGAEALGSTNPQLIDLTKEIADQTLVESMMYMDTQRYLPDDILVKVDRAAMAVSLETRVPFLDHKVVELAWSLPMNLKIHNGQSKWLVRQLLQHYVPEDLYDRPKMGFGVPIDQWLRGPLKSWAQDLLSNSMLAKHGLLNNKLVQRKWQEHQTGTRNWQYHLWDVLMFQAWYEANHG